MNQSIFLDENLSLEDIEALIAKDEANRNIEAQVNQSFEGRFENISNKKNEWANVVNQLGTVVNNQFNVSLAALAKRKNIISEAQAGIHKLNEYAKSIKADYANTMHEALYTREFEPQQ